MQDESRHFWSLRPAGSDRTLDTKRPADLQLFTSGGLPTVMVKRCEECVTDVKVEVVVVVVVVVVGFFCCCCCCRSCHVDVGSLLQNNI